MTSRNVTQTLIDLLPGLLLTTGIAFLGLTSSEIIGRDVLGFDNSPISGIMMAIVFGLLIGNLLELPDVMRPGVQFSMKLVLRAGIILLGIRLSLGDVVRFGSLALPLIVLCITGALLLTNWLGRRLNLSDGMTRLIAVGTSICGATAIVATAPAIHAKEEETTYAVANITVFGVLAMFLYPYLANLIFAGDQTGAGLFLGTSIHETAQVAGGGLIYAQVFDAGEALDVATVTKLIRNVFIAFMVPYMTFQHMQHSDTETSDAKGFFGLFPLFIIGFLLMALVRTVGDVTVEDGRAWGLFNPADWDALTESIKTWAERLLAVAMAAVGVGTSFKQLAHLGLKPFYAGLGASVTVGGLSLLGIAALQLIGAY